MNLALLFPAALAALSALILPLIIHLARRSEQRPTDFSALRWLRQKPKPRHRLRFDEWPLLLLRLLLLILLALWLARPVLFGSANTQPWIAVHPAVDSSAVQAMKRAKEARLHWLSPGFPELTQAKPDTRQPSSSLLRQLDAELPSLAPLTVLVPADLYGTDAQRPRLSRAVDWQVVPATVKPPVAATTEPLRVIVRHVDDRGDALRYVRAAVQAWDAGAAASKHSLSSIAPASQPLESDARQLIWLVPGRLPASIEQWIRHGGVALLDSTVEVSGKPVWTPLWKNAEGDVRVEAAGLDRGRLLRFIPPLQPAMFPELLEPDFPRQLRALFQSNPPAPTRVNASDHVPAAGMPGYPQPPRDLQPWLLALIALVFAIERWLATARRAQDLA